MEEISKNKKLMLLMGQAALTTNKIFNQPPLTKTINVCFTEKYYNANFSQSIYRYYEANCKLINLIYKIKMSNDRNLYSLKHRALVVKIFLKQLIKISSENSFLHPNANLKLHIFTE